MENLLIVLSFIVGAGTIFGIFNFLIKPKYVSKETLRNNLKKSIRKRGLLILDFTWSGNPNGYVTDDTVVALQMEFEVVDETDELVKIVLTDITGNDGAFLDDYHMKSYKKTFEKWYNNDDKNITWIKENKKEVRKRKLEELLK